MAVFLVLQVMHAQLIPLFNVTLKLSMESMLKSKSPSFVFSWRSSRLGASKVEPPFYYFKVQAVVPKFDGSSRPRDYAG